MVCIDGPRGTRRGPHRDRAVIEHQVSNLLHDKFVRSLVGRIGSPQCLAVAVAVNDKIPIVLIDGRVGAIPRNQGLASLQRLVGRERVSAESGSGQKGNENGKFKGHIPTSYKNPALMLHGSSVPVETGKVQYRARGGFTILENANALTKKHPHPAPLLRVFLRDNLFSGCFTIGTSRQREPLKLRQFFPL